MNHRIAVLLFSVAAVAVIVISGCEAMKASRPLIPIREYERMIVGRIDANYIGTKNCLSACHYHDKIRQDFEASTMGAQLSGTSGMPLVDCESCHGPGSLAVETLTPEKVREDLERGVQTACKYETLINLKTLPAPAKSLICLKCHSANATFNLHNWNAGMHALNDVACSDCHNVHAGPDLITAPKDTYTMCIQCHREIQAVFSLPSHHPVPEKKIFCTNCHDPHGTAWEKLLRKRDVKETCAQCHADKQGPFTYEHADIMDDCRECHNPHGAIGNNLLTVTEPFLCLQCHEGHWIRTAGAPSSAESKGALFTRCSDCHSQIHGTDIPSPSGRGRFIQ